MPPITTTLNLSHTCRIFPITGDSMLPITDGSDVNGKFFSDWTEFKADTPYILMLNADQDFVFKLVTFNRNGTLAFNQSPYTRRTG